MQLISTEYYTILLNETTKYSNTTSFPFQFSYIYVKVPYDLFEMTLDFTVAWLIYLRNFSTPPCRLLLLCTRSRRFSKSMGLMHEAQLCVGLGQRSRTPPHYLYTLLVRESIPRYLAPRRQLRRSKPGVATRGKALISAWGSGDGAARSGALLPLITARNRRRSSSSSTLTASLRRLLQLLAYRRSSFHYASCFCYTRFIFH